MIEVTKKIDELIELLEEKNKTTEALNQKLSEKKQKLELEEVDLKDRFEKVDAMRRLYEKYADFDKNVKEFNKKKSDLSERIKKAQEQEDNDAKVLAKIEAETKRLDARKLALNKQAEALDKKEAELKQAKEDLKMVMSGEKLKGILA